MKSSFFKVLSLSKISLSLDIKLNNIDIQMPEWKRLVLNQK